MKSFCKIYAAAGQNQRKFYLTFRKTRNIITEERVANKRKSSFAARFLFISASKSV